MLDAVRRHWVETRADAALNKAQGIIQRYHASTISEQYLVFSAFRSLREDVEAKHGRVNGWSDARAKELSKAVLTLPRRGLIAPGRTPPGEISRMGAQGAALLSLYYEAQGLPGRAAETTVAIIQAWHSAASGDNPT